MSLKKEAFSCKNPDGYTINGCVLSPNDTEEKLPAVIISHGFTSTMKKTEPYGEYTASRGCRAFIFDFCGGSMDTSSEGSFEDYMTPLTEKGDLLEVVKYVQSNTDVDPGKIILVGCSQGGFVSALAAAVLDAQIAGLVLQYPALCIPDDARKGSMQIIRFDPNNIPDHVGTAQMRVCRAYPASVMNMDIFAEIKGYHGPVMISHGTKDSIVPVSYAEKAYEVYQGNGNHTVLHLLEGSDHGYRGKYFEEACGYLGDFFKYVLK